MTKINSEIKDLSDKVLLDKYQVNSDQNFFLALYDRYLPLVKGVCLKYFKNIEEAQEIWQAIYSKVVLKIQQEEIGNFKSWLYVVVRNHCITEYNRRKKIFSKDDNFEKIGKNMEFDKADGLNILLEKEKSGQEEKLNQKLHDCIKNLAEKQEKCIRLFHFEEKTYEEIKDITNYTLDQVKSSLQNGRRNLKICLDE